MRIVGGSFGGRRLHTPKGARIRPTADRVREAIFSIIATHNAEADVLDLFAGSGALGLEALSRGAGRAVFVDQSSAAVRLIRANVAICRVEDRASIIHGAVPEVVRRLAGKGALFHLIFMDPPYGKGYPEKVLGYIGEVSYSSTLVVVEHHVKDILGQQCGGWLKTEMRKYGDTAVSFYVKDLLLENTSCEGS
ncbi:MAG: 16S rRNA (guanine(966)-N(2))-methyltransferase RsmD [Syntrophobacteraceae bacterium]